MKTRMLLVLVGVSLFFAACSSWHGPAEIQIKDGNVLKCDKGLSFDSFGVNCEGLNIKIPWNQVAGYRTK